MTRDDLSTFLGAVLCAFVGWYDEAWRLFWLGSAAVLIVWTISSIVRNSRNTEQ